MDPIYKQVFIFWLTVGLSVAIVGMGFFFGIFRKKSKYAVLPFIITIIGFLIITITLVNYYTKH